MPMQLARTDRLASRHAQTTTYKNASLQGLKHTQQSLRWQSNPSCSDELLSSFSKGGGAATTKLSRSRDAINGGTAVAAADARRRPGRLPVLAGGAPRRRGGQGAPPHVGHRLPPQVPRLLREAGRDHQRRGARPDHPRRAGRHRRGHRAQPPRDREHGHPLARHPPARLAVGRWHRRRHAVPHPPRRDLHLQIRRRQAGHVPVPRALRDAARRRARRHARRVGAGRRCRTLRLRRGAHRPPHGLVAQERLRAGRRARVRPSRVRRRATVSADQRPRDVRLLACCCSRRRRMQRLVRRSGGVHCRAGEDIPPPHRQPHVSLVAQLRDRGPLDDGGGSRRALREAGCRRQPLHLLRRDVLRPGQGRSGSVPELLGRVPRRRPKARDAERHGRPALRLERQRPAADAAAGGPRVGRRGAQVGAEQVPRRRAPGPRPPRAAEARPHAAPPQHAEQDRRPREVGHQRRVAPVPGDAVPRLDEARAPGRVRRPAPPGGRVRQLRKLRHRLAAGGERDGGERGVPAGAGVGGGRGAAEHGDAQRQERDAPVAPPRARLLGARLRRGQVRAREGRGKAQPEGPGDEEHGGAAPAGVDGGEVRGGQPRGVAVPLPRGGARVHGHGGGVRGGRRQGRPLAQVHLGLRTIQGPQLRC